MNLEKKIFIPLFSVLFLIYIFQNKHIEKMENQKDKCSLFCDKGTDEKWRPCTPACKKWYCDNCDIKKVFPKKEDPNKNIEKNCGPCLPLVTECKNCWAYRNKHCKRNPRDKRCKKKAPCYDKAVFGRGGNCEAARRCIPKCEKTHGPYEKLYYQYETLI